MEFDKNTITRIKSIGDFSKGEKELKDKIRFLRSIKTSVLAKAYANHLIGNLYIEIDAEKKGYARSMINYGDLAGWCWQSTASMIPFFKDNDQIIRGTLIHYNGGSLDHSWISFTIRGKEYVFDPCINILVEKEKYDEVFRTNEIARVSALDVRNAMLEILTTGEKSTYDGSRIIRGSEDITDPFYKADMHVKGETINKRVLTLNTHFDINA